MEPKGEGAEVSSVIIPDQAEGNNGVKASITDAEQSVSTVVAEPTKNDTSEPADGDKSENSDANPEDKSEQAVKPERGIKNRQKDLIIITHNAYYTKYDQIEGQLRVAQKTAQEKGEDGEKKKKQVYDSLPAGDREIHTLVRIGNMTESDIPEGGYEIGDNNFTIRHENEDFTTLIKIDSITPNDPEKPSNDDVFECRIGNDLRNVTVKLTRFQMIDAQLAAHGKEILEAFSDQPAVQEALKLKMKADAGDEESLKKLADPETDTLLEGATVNTGLFTTSDFLANISTITNSEQKVTATKILEENTQGVVIMDGDTAIEVMNKLGYIDPKKFSKVLGEGIDKLEQELKEKLSAEERDKKEGELKNLKKMQENIDKFNDNSIRQVFTAMEEGRLDPAKCAAIKKNFREGNVDQLLISLGEGMGLSEEEQKSLRELFGEYKGPFAFMITILLLQAAKATKKFVEPAAKEVISGGGQ